MLVLRFEDPRAHLVRRDECCHPVKDGKGQALGARGLGLVGSRWLQSRRKTQPGPSCYSPQMACLRFRKTMERIEPTTHGRSNNESFPNLEGFIPQQVRTGDHDVCLLIQKNEKTIENTI